MRSPGKNGSDIELPQIGFEALGPTVHSHEAGSGRRVRFIDEGPRSGVPVVFFGGAGTSVRAFRLLEFARPLRLSLGVRVVSVERNGLGRTSFDPDAGVTEHAEDVWSLLDHLGIREASLVAISGGGPYAAQVAAARPACVRSMHLACAYSEPIPGAQLDFDPRQVAADPVAWWTFPPESPVHRVPGFVDSAVEEATHAMFARGRDAEPEGLRQAFDLYARTPLPDLARVTGRAFMYWGSEDTLVPGQHIDRWKRSLQSEGREPKTTVRMYSGEGHDVQYRHWDQILTDVAYLGSKILVTANGRTLLADAWQEEGLMASGARLGLAAWHEPER
ncbi:alpha/beta fold hydrolase [Paenarthrobacter sp. NPDC089675]|uniref:alpha/beta fold hydrolase n=1 Tax=Paenarthrobacter sp. NPDC089675 TaxID=3364376 RepID=UPI00381BE12E